MEAGAPPADGWEGAGRGEVLAAGWWQRVGAALLDALVLITPELLLFAALVAGGSDAEWVVPAAIVSAGVSITAALLYAPLLMARKGERNGQTIGKQLARIRVVREDGRPLNVGRSALREVAVKQLLFGIGSFLFFIPNLVDSLWPLWDRRSQALHDKIVSTRVVRL